VFPPAPRRTLLTAVTLISPPARRSINGTAARLIFIVECCGTVQYDLGKRYGGTSLPDVKQNEKNKRKAGSRIRFELEDAAFLEGDVTVRFFIFDDDGPSPPHGAEIGAGARTVKYGNVVGRQLCFVTFNTAYHANGDCTFIRSEVDGAYNKSERDFPMDFAITITLNESMGWTSPRSPLMMPNTGMSTPASPEQVPLEKGNTRPMPSVSRREGSTGPGSASLRGPSSSSLQSSSLTFFSGVCATNAQCIPYGLGVGRRMLRLHGAVQEIFRSVCPVPITFKRGEFIWCDGEDGTGGESSNNLNQGRKLCLIVSGFVEYAPADRGQQPPRINRGDSISRLQVHEIRLCSRAC
jgi:hypothetical protein